MYLTLNEHSSHMQGAKKLIVSGLHICNSTTKPINNSFVRHRITEN